MIWIEKLYEQPMVLFILGLAAGILLTCVVIHYKNALAKAVFQSQLDALQQKADSQTHIIETIKSEMLTLDNDLKTKNQDFLELSKAYASAQTRLETIVQLETGIRIKEQENAELTQSLSLIKAEQAELKTIIDKERQNAAEKIQMLENFRNNMADAFKAMSSSALEKNNQTFMDLARSVLSNYMEGAQKDLDQRQKQVKEVIAPVKEALDKYDTHIQAMERAREKAYGGLSEQVDSLFKTQQDLTKETGKLVQALRLPHVRGRWGEITLRRVAEISGMQNRCDFIEQPTLQKQDGPLRPDMVINLPEHKQIVVDAKVPLTAYLDALEAQTEEERNVFLSTHAKHLKTHIKNLSQKAYWAQFESSPDFVVLFIPGENFFSAALSQNPGLIEEGIDQGVILATPTTLISLLKIVALGWRQKDMTDNARAISDLGKELYQRIFLLAGHFNRLGRDIEKCGVTYNQVLGSLESRVLISARRFNDMGLCLKNGDDIPIIDSTNIKARSLTCETDHEKDGIN